MNTLHRLAAPALLLSTAACAGAPPPAPPPMVRVDTIVVTREVAPPLPQGQPAAVCLATGRSAEIRITAAGDTLIGPARVRLADLGGAVGFAGTYAADQPWFVRDEPVPFDRRQYRRFGQPITRDCPGIKIVGEHRGVNLFADVAASPPFDVLLVPASPGVFQPYQTQVGRVRG
jgi:hypothetical protein